MTGPRDAKEQIYTAQGNMTWKSRRVCVWKWCPKIHERTHHFFTHLDSDMKVGRLLRKTQSRTGHTSFSFSLNSCVFLKAVEGRRGEKCVWVSFFLPPLNQQRWRIRNLMPALSHCGRATSRKEDIHHSLEIIRLKLKYFMKMSRILSSKNYDDVPRHLYIVF